MFNKTVTEAANFPQELIHFDELYDDTTDHGRFYTTPTGNVWPSVTTILQDLGDKTALNNWKKWKGEAEASKITQRSGARGSAFHSICENYVTNKPDYDGNSNYFAKNLFQQIKPFLDKNLTKVYGSEVALYSDRLKTAGRSDLYGVYRGIDSVIDFKNSIKEKQEKWIQSYFYQTACYGEMIEELTGRPVKQLVLLIGVEQGHPQEIIKPIDEYRQDMIDFFMKDR